MNEQNTETTIPANREIPGQRIGNQLILTTLADFFNWAKASSLWPMQFGLACCAIEMIATAATGFDWIVLEPESFARLPARQI